MPKSSDVLWLAPEAARVILEHCLQERPREACGWLAGHWGPGGPPPGPFPAEPAGPKVGPAAKQMRDGRSDPSASGPAGNPPPVHGYGLRAYPMRNVAADPVRRYLMDPEEQFAVLRTLRRNGESLIAIYHSHPATPAVPSATDIDLAYTKDAMYLIVSLAGDCPSWRAWWLDADTRRVEEVTIRRGAGGGEPGGFDHHRKR